MLADRASAGDRAARPHCAESHRGPRQPRTAAHGDRPDARRAPAARPPTTPASSPCGGAHRRDQPRNRSGSPQVGRYEVERIPDRWVEPRSLDEVAGDAFVRGIGIQCVLAERQHVPAIALAAEAKTPCWQLLSAPSARDRMRRRGAALLSRHRRGPANRSQY